LATFELDYRPRKQFVGFHNRRERFACLVAHRRAGKTVACVHDLQRAALQCELERPRFAYISPYRGQSKQVAWDYLVDAAKPFFEIGAIASVSELRVDYPNGGQVRLYGADNPDALRGIWLDGCVLDEYADMDPRLWSEVLRPALSDRGGWAVFIGTPRGRNDFYNIHKRAQSDPTWFSLILKASQTGLISAAELESARLETKMLDEVWRFYSEEISDIDTASTGVAISDGSRAELDFFRRAYEAAVEAGAKEAVVVDTIGVATPEGAAFLVGQTVDWLDVPVHWHGHDDFGLATAAAVAAVQAGATWVHGTVNGMGERAGNANLLEVALALEALYGIPTRLDLTKARELAALVQKRSGYSLAPWAPITGENLFTRESGAVASQFHDPPAIEPYSSELVGAERGVVLGKKSGIDSIRIALARLGLDVPPDRQAELLAEVKRLGTAEQRLVTDDEIAVMAGGLRGRG
jgi:hypothetical protein